LIGQVLAPVRVYTTGEGPELLLVDALDYLLKIIRHIRKSL